MAKLILGLSGEIGSGKGTVAKYIVETYQANSYRFSDSLRDVMRRLYIEENRVNLRKVSLMLRENFGQDILSQVVVRDVIHDLAEIVIVDGLRRVEEWDYLREIPEFRLLYIESDLEKRYERVVGRGENSDEHQKTFEEFKRDMEGETEVRIRELKEKADFVVENNGVLEELYGKIDEVIMKNITIKIQKDK